MAYIGILEKAKEGELPFNDSRLLSEKRVEELSVQIVSLEQQRSVERFVSNLIADLQSTPFCDDPGKNHRAVFFLTKNHEPAICTTVKDVDMSGSIAKVNPGLEKIYLQDALKDSCPACHDEAFVLQIYHQTEDSPEGDTWMKCEILFCPHCNHAFKHRDPEYRSHRF
jgi:hypothetical protein